MGKKSLDLCPWARGRGAQSGPSPVIPRGRGGEGGPQEVAETVRPSPRSSGKGNGGEGAESGKDSPPGPFGGDLPSPTVGLDWSARSGGGAAPAVDGLRPKD